MKNKKLVLFLVATLIILFAVSVGFYLWMLSTTKNKAEKATGYTMTTREAKSYNDFYVKPKQLTNKAEQDKYLSKLKQLKNNIDNSH